MPYPWSAGNVLTATDLNSALAAKAAYPSGGTNGNALIKSGTTTAWGNAGSLTLITTAW